MCCKGNELIGFRGGLPFYFNFISLFDFFHLNFITMNVGVRLFSVGMNWMVRLSLICVKKTT